MAALFKRANVRGEEANASSPFSLVGGKCGMVRITCKHVAVPIPPLPQRDRKSVV